MRLFYKAIYLSISVLLIFSCTSKNNDLEKIKYDGITRTMHLLKTSNEVNRNEINILFYGQSIVGSLKSDILIDSLKKKYPYANIKHKNKAIGGFTLPSLIKTAEHDLYLENPDLIVFHGYDGIKNGLFDSLVGNIRKRLNSDILLFDHHYVWDKPQSKLDLINKSHDSDSKAIEEIAKKYNCEFVDVRKQWKNHLESNNTRANELIGNTFNPDVHPNDNGNRLLRKILLSAFNNSHTLPYNIKKDDLRDEFFLKKGVKDTTLRFFTNRLVVETNRKFNKGAKIEVFINEKKPSEIKSNYIISRPSVGHESWMPGVKKVSMGSVFPREELWEIKILEIDRVEQTFKFELSGSLTGFDGQGSSQSNFISNSGRILINKEDLNVFRIEKITKIPTPENFKINFTLDLLVKDTLELKRRASKYLLFIGNNAEKVKVRLKVIQGVPELKYIYVSRPYLQ